MCACVYVCAVSGRHLLSAEASLFIFRGATLKDKVSGQVSSPGQPDANLSQALLHPQLIFPQLPIVLSNCWTTVIGSLTVSASNYAVGPNIKRDCLSTFDSQDKIRAITLDKLARKPVGPCFRLSSDPTSISKKKPLWFPNSAIHEMSISKDFGLSWAFLVCPECFAESEVNWDCCFIWQEEGIVLRQRL